MNPPAGTYQRTGERTNRISVVSSPPTTENLLNVNGEKRSINNLDQNYQRPSWNSSTVPQISKTPRSVFIDNGRPISGFVQRQIITSPMKVGEITTPVQVVRLPSTTIQEPSKLAPTYIQNIQQMYPANAKLIRTEPEGIILILYETKPDRRSIFDCFRRSKIYGKQYYGDNEILINHSKSPVYRFCECCARGRIASSCPSCYFCELFYGCPLYCWVLTFLLLLLPMLALFGWLLSEQPALNAAKRQYVTEQSSIVQSDVYAVMHNCAVPYCTIASPATTINQLYLTNHYYSATEVTSNANTFQKVSIFFVGFSYFLLRYCEL